MTKIPKSGIRIFYHRSHKRFNPDSFMDDVKDLQWSDVSQENDVNIVLNFMDKLVKFVGKHALLKRKVC